MMVGDNRSQSEMRRIVREELDVMRGEMNRNREKIVLILLFGFGTALLIGSAFLTDVYWQSLLMNIGSNLAVFVGLLWYFQYLIGRQPGNNEDTLSPSLKNSLVEGQAVGSTESPSSMAPHRRTRDTKYKNSDEATISTKQ